MTVALVMCRARRQERACARAARVRDRRTLQGPSGFTLIELLVVILVLGLLAGLVGPRILGRVSEAKSATGRTQLEMLATALDTYRLDAGAYPTTEQGLRALTEPPSGSKYSWRGPYLRKDVPTDPWGRPYIYRSPAAESRLGFDLLSYGADG